MQDQQQMPQSDEITLKELVMKVNEYYRECLRNWRTIFLFVLPFLGYQIWLRFNKPAYYSAVLTFMVNDAKGSSVGGILGQLGGLVGEDEDKLDKILELAKSRRTMSNALFQHAEINGKTDYLANHLIEAQRLHKDWQNDTLLAQFKFSRDNLDSFNLKENRALYALHKILIGSDSTDPIFGTTSNKKTGIMAFSLKTNNQQLTLVLIKQIFASLSNFYVASTIRKEKESFDILVAKRDSIAGMLFRNDVATAQHDDQSNSLLMQVDKVPAKRYNRNNMVLTQLYGELVKNTELAEFALKTATPFITSIDEPIPPLKPIGFGRAKDMIIYTLAGCIIGIIFVVSRFVFRSALRE